VAALMASFQYGSGFERVEILPLVCGMLLAAAS